jgi:hypothetical protein
MVLGQLSVGVGDAVIEGVAGIVDVGVEVT